jgi:serine protease Do
VNRLAVLALSTALLLARGLPGDEDDPPLKAAVALEAVMQRVIKDVEPSVACILVSRSDAYQRLGVAPKPEMPGKLGGFDAEALTLPARLSDEERKAFRKKLDLADADHVPETFGSGVVIDIKGLILTNYHVVRDATKIFVRLPGDRGAYADIHAADPRSDLAVLRLIEPAFKPKAVKLGGAGKCKRGQFILTIANPYAAGFRDGQPSVSWGIVSNLRRRLHAPLKEEDLSAKTLHHFGTLIQTDARLNLGSSGGALVNLKGEVIGLTTAWAAIHGGETPGGYAIPLDAGMQRIIEVLKRGEEVDYGFLGVHFRERRGKGGVTLEYVVPGSPAQQAQLREGDVIVSFNDAPIHQTDDLFLALGTQLAGSKITLGVRRPGGGVDKIEATVAKFHVPGPKIASSLGARPFFKGLRVDYTSLLAQPPQRGGLRRIPAGVFISELEPKSAADQARLKVGEVITHVNGRPVNTPVAFYQEVARGKGPVEFTLASFSADPPPKIILN